MASDTAMVPILSAILKSWTVVVENTDPTRAETEVIHRLGLYRKSALRLSAEGCDVPAANPDDPYLMVQAVESVADDVKAGRPL